MTVRLSLIEVHALAKDTLVANNVSDANAGAVADTVTAAEGDTCASHGLFRVPGYVASVRSGRVDGHAVPLVEDTAPGIVKVDAKDGFAPPALNAGRGPLIEKTRGQGIAALAIRDSHHFAALWPDLEPFANAGMVAMAFVNSQSFIPPWGGRTPLFGTNPMGFACPRKNGPPMIWDQASAAMARGEIQIAARESHSVAEGAGLDKDGNPTTDPNAILEGGVQLPFGGYKGSAIALMVDLMAAGLTGGNFSYEAQAKYNNDGGPAQTGEFILAIDAEKFGGAAFLDRVEALFAQFQGNGAARLPGDRRLAARKRTPSEGAEIPRTLYDTIVGLRDG